MINEAASADDIRTFLDATVLKRLWPSLWLPSPIRRAWESRFAELAELTRRASA